VFQLWPEEFSARQQSCATHILDHYGRDVNAYRAKVLKGEISTFLVNTFPIVARTLSLPSCAVPVHASTRRAEL
jgi:hypothetical protein